MSSGVLSIIFVIPASTSSSGGNALPAHVRFAAASQCFGLVPLPIAQQFNSIVDYQRFRLGAGVIVILSKSGR